jgi:uncharacterized membrane protein
VDTYLWLKLIHVVAAIVAVGTNVTYFVWLSRLKRASGADTAILLGIKALDSRLANPAYVVLPVTGILMVINERLGFTTFWILAAIVLYAAVGVAAGALFSPALRRQVALAEDGQTESPEFAHASQRTILTGLITMVPIAGILYLMVMKPTP